MFSRSFVVRIGSLGLVLLGLNGNFAFAQTADTEKALALNPDSPQLEWGACPPFLPAGCAIAVLHGDPSKENLDVFLKLPGLSEVPAHWHTSAERMVLVSGVLHVTYEGQSESILTPGTYAYGPAKRPHHGRCASADPCILFIAFESPLDAVPVAAPAD
jgi:quercetin dioxygenase-like cupin family protein